VFGGGRGEGLLESGQTRGSGGVRFGATPVWPLRAAPQRWKPWSSLARGRWPRRAKNRAQDW